jgi:phenylalanyl-tRNA synthetase beta chain
VHPNILFTFATDRFLYGRRSDAKRLDVYFERFFEAMKVSLNWLRDFLEIDKTPDQIEAILTSLGLEVEGWEIAKPSPVDLDKVVVAQVLTCERIPETDHLSATTVEAGDGVVRSIVCGAPNVAAGQRVLVALPGANVFSKDGTLFTIGERKVKGFASQGMICAEDELGIGHDHSGIKILPADAPLGQTAADYFQMASDVVFEVGLTPNRADATNHRGVAQDLLAYIRHHERPDAQLRQPDLADFSKKNNPATSGPMRVRVENEAACPRYAAMSIEGVQVGESPEWLKNRLLAVGQRPINNVVDITNYVRIELGQPLHAFDQAVIGGGEVVVKTLPAGTVFQSLDGADRKLYAEDLMICDAHDAPMCMGGVFGGVKSGVSDGTTTVFLESAYFHPTYIRRSMLRHGLRTDAAWSFEKGVDPNGCVVALQRAALLMEQLTGGRVVGEVIDVYPTPVPPARISFEYARVNRLIGHSLDISTQKNILAALGIALADETATGAVALIPTNKPDVTREADLVEEILRVYGLDNVPMPQSIRSSIEITPKPDPDAIRHQVSEMLSAQGFLECMSLSLSNSDYYTGEKAVLPQPADSLIRVHNTANQGLDCLRPTLIINGLETIRNNQNRQNPDLRVYEFGKTYQVGSAGGSQVPFPAGTHWGGIETARLALMVTGVHSGESWHPTTKKEVDFFTLKTYVVQLLARLGVSGYQETALQSEGAFQYALRLHRGPQELVTLGRVQPSLCKKFDVKNAVFAADFNFENVVAALASNKVSYREVSKFPTVRRDLALVLDKSVAFGELRQLAGRTIKKTLKDVNLFDVFEDESKLGAGKQSYAVSFVFEDPEKTLQDKEIEAMMGQLVSVFEAKLGAVVRR